MVGPGKGAILGQAGWLALLAVGPAVQLHPPAMLHRGLGQSHNGQAWSLERSLGRSNGFSSALQMSPISMGLQDGHHYVRRTAVLGVLKVYNLDASAVRNAGGSRVPSGLQSWQLCA